MRDPEPSLRLTCKAWQCENSSACHKEATIGRDRTRSGAHLPVLVLHRLRLGIALFEQERGRVPGHAVEGAQADRLTLPNADTWSQSAVEQVLTNSEQQRKEKKKGAPLPKDYKLGS